MPALSRDRIRWLATAGIVVLVVLIMLTSFSKSSAAEDATRLVKAGTSVAPPEPATMIAVAPPASAAQIGVDVIGAVQQPGVYYLDDPARIDDAVAAAGGLAPDADRERINLAARVSDGQQIRVPRVGEDAQPGAAHTPDRGPASSAAISINHADAMTLASLAGIGPATAEAIVAYRTSNGPFKQIEDVQNVKGIGPALFSKIKDQITVDP